MAHIVRLIEEGHAYVRDGEVFYDVASFEHYGERSKTPAKAPAGNSENDRTAPSDASCCEIPLDPDA